jgi:type IV secretion system protein VirD4
MLSPSALNFLKYLIVDIVQTAKKNADTEVLCIFDELSFYPTPILSGALATVAGFGVKVIVAYQDDAQLADEAIKKAIKSNCQLKIYYKSSDIETVNYIEKISGLELITKATKEGNSTRITQDVQPYFNISKQRALPKSRVAVAIDENDPFIKVFQTWPIKTNFKPIKWDNYFVEKTTFIPKIEKEYNLLKKDKKDNNENEKNDEKNQKIDI